MALISDFVQWDRPARLIVLDLSSGKSDWVGDWLYSGTIDGAVALFASLPVEVQRRAEMFVDVGSVPGAASTILATAELTELARPRTLRN